MPLHALLWPIFGFKELYNLQGGYDAWQNATIMKMDYLTTFLSGYANYAGYLWYEISHPGWHNYFLLVAARLCLLFGLELMAPWRKDQ